jgi:hypothetical protein
MDAQLDREWLVTNGLGGYAMGTLAGIPTRGYHGLLIAALPAPLGRTLLLGPLREQTRLSTGELLHLSGAEYVGGHREWDGGRSLADFRLEAGLPVWRYRLEGKLLEKRPGCPTAATPSPSPTSSSRATGCS